MPGPRIVNKEQEARKAALVERKQYFLTDPHCKELMGITVTDQVRENGLMLTQSEAMTLVANGALTTDKTAATEAADTMKEQHEALLQRREDDKQALLDEQKDATDAAAHNAGDPVDKPADQGSGALTADEVDQHMVKPSDGTSPAPVEQAAVDTAGTPPPNADLASSAEPKTDAAWAAR